MTRQLFQYYITQLGIIATLRYFNIVLQEKFFKGHKSFDLRLVLIVETSTKMAENSIVFMKLD